MYLFIMFIIIINISILINILGLVNFGVETNELEYIWIKS